MKNNKVFRVVMENNTYFILLLLLIVCAIISPNFFTVQNITNLLRQYAGMIVVCMGMLFVILTGGIVLYLVVFAWLVIFSRSAASGYSVHVDPLRDQIDAFSTDHGFSDVFRRFFTEGFSAFRSVELVRPDDLIQFFLNDCAVRISIRVIGCVNGLFLHGH